MAPKACSAVMLFAATAYLAAAVSSTSVHAASFACGKRGALCGASAPTGVKCAKGPGYCDPGYFCGWTFSDTNKTTACMPVPKPCGTDGQSCCPGNMVEAITNATATPMPYCSDGSFCFYTPTPDASGWSSPPYSSPANLLGKQQRQQQQLISLVAALGTAQSLLAQSCIVISLLAAGTCSGVRLTHQHDAIIQ